VPAVTRAFDAFQLVDVPGFLRGCAGAVQPADALARQEGQSFLDELCVQRGMKSAFRPAADALHAG